MKVISPLRIGIGLRPLPQRRGHSSVLTGRLSFDLLQPANFVPDAKLWPLVQAAAGTEPPFDAGMHKPNAEVLLWGEACSATPVEEAIVELRCGAVAKRLRVIGNRHWQPGPLGWRASRAEPFTRMPLAWDRSFGGEAFDRCPVGQGHDGERRLADREHVMLPNLETPGSPLLHPGDIAEPACFAAVDPRWPCARPDGTYDAHWLASQHPAAPADESPAVHNLAPLDQRLPGRHFLGGEPIEIRGMHPEHALIASHVPALRMWAFFVRRGADELEAIELKADTLSLLPGALLGVLHFRAILADTGPDLRSISSLMMAAEWADRPKPLEHYVATHRLRSDPEHGAEHMLRDLQLMPELTEDQRTRREAVRERQRAARAVEDKAFKAALDRKIIGPAGSARAAFMLSAIAASAAARPPGDLDSDALDRVQWPEITEEDGELGDVDFAGISRAADETRSIAAQLMAQSQRDVGQAAAESEKMAAELEQQAQTLRAAMAADKQTLLAGEHLAVRSPLLPPEVVRPDIDTRASMRSFAERLESGSGSSNDALLEFMLEQGGAPLDDAQRASVQHDWANAMAQAQWSDDPASRARTASGLRDAMAQADTLPSRRPAGAPPPDSNAAGAILGRLKFAETADGGVEAAALPDIGVAADGTLDMQGLQPLLDSSFPAGCGEALPQGLAGELGKINDTFAQEQAGMVAAQEAFGGLPAGLQDAMAFGESLLDPAQAEAQRERSMQALRAAASVGGRDASSVDASVHDLDLHALTGRTRAAAADLLRPSDRDDVLSQGLTAMENDAGAAGFGGGLLARSTEAATSAPLPVPPLPEDMLVQYRAAQAELAANLGPLVPQAVRPDGLLDLDRVRSQVEASADETLAQLKELQPFADEPPAPQQAAGESTAAALARELALGDPKQGRTGRIVEPGEVDPALLQADAWQGDEGDHPRLAREHEEAELEAQLEYRQQIEQATAAGVPLTALPLPPAPKPPAAAKPDVRQPQHQAMQALAAQGGSDLEQAFREGRRIALSAMVDPGLTPQEAAALGAMVATRARTTSFAGRDLAGIDLRGADLRGIDFTGTYLELARLDGADLRGAKCAGVVLTGAVLSGSRFDGADLTGANLNQSVAQRASFDGAALAEAKLSGADFSFASLRRADLRDVSAFSSILHQADCTGSRWERTMLSEPDFTQARLGEARLQGVGWIKPRLGGCEAQASDWTDARLAEPAAPHLRLDAACLDGALFAGGDMDRLCAAGAHARGATWMETGLNAANFNGALLDDARFAGAALQGAEFVRATAAQADFAGSDLEGADFSQAQLMHAQLRAARLPGASASQAQLRASDLDGAMLDRCDLSDADTRHTLIALPHDGTLR